MAFDTDPETLQYYDRVAASYDVLLGAQPQQEAIRRAFRKIVLQRADEGSCLLDFGAGTGADAAWYAARGRRVVAYEPAPGMMERLRARCEAEIERGVVIPVEGGPGTLADALRREGPIEAVAANFAALNHVRDLDAAFALFSAVRPGGHAVLSVQNPFYWRDLLLRAWWKGLVHGWKDRRIRFDGDTVTYKHFVRRILAAARPEFSPVLRGSWVSGRLRTAPILDRVGHLLFLVLRRSG